MRWLALAALLAGCGVKAPPRPPQEPSAPVQPSPGSEAPAAPEPGPAAPETGKAP